MRFVAVVFILLSIFLIVFPQFFDCEEQGRALELANGRTVPMKCHWSSLAMIVAGVPLLILGIILLITQEPAVRTTVSALAIVMGVLAGLVPTFLIGVCGMDTMICRMVMQPGILLAAGLVVILGIVALVLSRRPVA